MIFNSFSPKYVLKRRSLRTMFPDTKLNQMPSLSVTVRPYVAYMFLMMQIVMVLQMTNGTNLLAVSTINRRQFTTIH